MSDLLWATVTAVSPLRIKLDGDSSALLITPETLIDASQLSISDRVRVDLTNKRLTVLGRVGGFVVPDATTGVKGVSLRSADADAITGTATDRTLSPANLTAWLAARPMFQVFKLAAAFTMPTGWTLANAAWGTAHASNGFTSWSAGVLTIAKAGLYRISSKLMVVGSGVLGLQVLRNGSTVDTNAISNQQQQSNFSANRTVSDSFLYQLAATDTLRVYWIDTAGGTTATAPMHAQFGVEFIR